MTPPPAATGEERKETQPELTPAATAAAAATIYVASDRFRINRFHFDLANHVGCTRLIRVTAQATSGATSAYLGE